MTKIIYYSTADRPDLKTIFKDLNIEWISKNFEIEENDVKQLENPDQIIANGGEIIFIEHKNIVSGVSAMVHQGFGRYELAKMAVRPDQRGQGIGDALMNACLEWTEKRQIKELFLLSNTKLEPAITLYKKYGFIAIEEGYHPDYKRCNIIMKYDPNRGVSYDE